MPDRTEPMRDHPILFSAPMIRALLDGRKTETRRVIKPQPLEYQAAVIDITEPTQDGETGEWGQWETEWKWCGGPHPEPMRETWVPLKLRHAPGDLLWVREAFARVGDNDDDIHACPDLRVHAYYRADAAYPEHLRWRSPIHMPRWASRITLLVRDVRVERLQEITEDAAKREGIYRTDAGDWTADASWAPLAACAGRGGFYCLWNHLHARDGYGWDANPWVTVTRFDVLRGNIDAQQREKPTA